MNAVEGVNMHRRNYSLTEQAINATSFSCQLKWLQTAKLHLTTDILYEAKGMHDQEQW